MKKLMSLMAALMLVCTGAAAQGNLLKGLGEKAVNKATGGVQKKVEKKVDQTVDNAVDKALEGIFGKSTQKSSNETTAASNETAQCTFSTCLMNENPGIDLFAEAPETSSIEILSLQDLKKYRPDWPSSADLASRDAYCKYAAKVQDYSVAAGQLLSVSVSMNALLRLAGEDAVTGDASVKSAKSEAISAELSSIAKSRSDKKQSLSAGLRASLKGEKVEDKYSISGGMAGTKAEIVSAWHSSDQNQKIQDKAKIDAWNKAQLEKWVAALKEWESANCADALKIIRLDAELDALPSAEKESAAWQAAKKQVNDFSVLMTQWAMIPSSIFNCPFVEYP